MGAVCLDTIGDGVSHGEVLKAVPCGHVLHRDCYAACLHFQHRNGDARSLLSCPQCKKRIQRSIKVGMDESTRIYQPQESVDREILPGDLELHYTDAGKRMEAEQIRQAMKTTNDRRVQSAGNKYADIPDLDLNEFDLDEDDDSDASIFLGDESE